MSNYGYGGGRQNPYDQRSGSPAQGGPPYPQGGGYTAQPYGAPPPQQQQYGRQQQYNAQAMGRDEYSGQNVEMEPLAPNGQQFGRQNDPNAILDDCREIEDAIKHIESRLDQLAHVQRAVLGDSDTSPTSRNKVQLDTLSGEIMEIFRGLTARVKRIKSKPESGSSRNSKQVGFIDRRLKAARSTYQSMDTDFSQKLQEQMARQYRIVRPEASEAEVREAVQDTSNQQVFSQALLQGNRQGQSRSALAAVQSRHEDIQKIERQMIELAALFQDMDNLVVQQEAAVTNIEMKGEEVVENMDKGTEQIGVAIKSARNARKWKWWCLGISVLIIVIIVIVILLWQFVFGPNAKANRDGTKSKRFVLPSSLAVENLVVPGQPFDTDSNIDVPGLEWTQNNELVRKTKRFQA